MPEDGVLVLDANERSALAVVRSLGRAGIPVYAADTGVTALAGCSRFCRGYYRVSNPATSAEEYRASVRAVASKTNVGFVLPMSDASTGILLQDESELHLMAPPRAAYEWLSNKHRLLQLADSLGVPVPRTIPVTTQADAKAAALELGFPLVLKPQRSRVLCDDRIVATNVHIVENEKALLDRVRGREAPSSLLLAQEYIAGHGVGTFALFGDLGPVAWFSHLRIREKPPAGGVSVVSEGIAMDPQLKTYSEQLLSAAGWSGPAMVEWRIATDGNPFLMEINGRFWGSLQLAIDSGVDFPLLYYSAAHGRALPAQDYQVGRRLRWMLGDFDRLLLQLRGRGTSKTLLEKTKELFRFVNIFTRRQRLEVLRLQDPRPFLWEAREWLRAVSTS